jgi:flagellar protein FliJ
MTNIFRLAGLHRLRKMQEDATRAELARTRATAVQRRRDEQRVRAVLGDSAVEVTDAATVQSIAAARASSSSMLVELDALLAQDQEAIAIAAAAHAEALARTRQLDKLEERHDARVRTESLRAEQLVLDEHAGRAKPEGGTR